MMFEKPELKDVKIPRLNPTLRLFRAEADQTGAPRWRLYHALSNTYFDIGWPEFEALSRFSTCTDAQDLKNKIEKETTLELDEDDIPSLIAFLDQNGLLASSDTFSNDFKPSKKMPIWKKIVHNYLFFSVPLFKPNIFLKNTCPIVKPFFSQGFFTISMMVLFVFSIMTLGRIDEFTHTFFQFFSMEGVITITVVFFFIKILHEFGHAYTAYKNGVDVPHMGLAFIVMYPILYTETTGAWRLDSKKKRMSIGLAGIRTELILAAYALAAWHFLAPGFAQSLAFSIVAISLAGSLLVNLNPLMRFDGYFVMSDYTGIENLHARGFAAARWQLRRTLFGLKDAAPEANKARLNFLIYFGFAVMIYRFFLFLGIALLVYHIFFKPLGLFLMIVEIMWFILLPIWSEVKVWIERRSEIIKQRRSKITVGLLGVCLVMLALPSSNTIALPAISHIANYRAIFPSVPAKVKTIQVQNNQKVEKGDILMTLHAPALQKDLDISRLQLETLRREKRQLQSSGELAKERLAIIDIELETAEKQYALLQEQKDNLTIRAEFSGVIRDLNKDIASGQFITGETMLFRLLKPSDHIITAYADSHNLNRIKLQNTANFRPHHRFLSRDSYIVSSIDRINVEELDWPELSSIYGGSIASEFAPDDQSGIIPRQSLYKIQFNPANNDISKPNITEKGVVYVHGDYTSPIWRFIQSISALFMQEISLN